MAIYVGENNALLLKKDRSVVELYKGDKKIFGYNDSAEGKVIAVGNAHPIEHKLKVEVKSKNLFNKDMDFTSDNFISEMSYRYTYFIQLLPNTTYYVKTFNPLAPSYCGYTFINSKKAVASSVDTAVCVSGNYSTGEGDWHIENYITTDDSGRLYIGNNQSLEKLKTAVQEANIQIELASTPTSYTEYVADFSAVNVTRCGKNLLEYPYVETTLTRNGITFTDNGDGTITANGTATADTQFKLQDRTVYPKNYNPFKYLIGEKVLVLGSPSGSSKDTYGIQSISIGTFTNTGYTVGGEHYYRYAIFIKSGMTVENLVFKPVIFLQNVGFSNDFEQYNRQTVTANADGTVKELTSHSPNMTLFTDTQGVTINCEYVKG